MAINNPASNTDSAVFSNCTNNLYPLAANKANTFLAANKSRSYAVIVNNSSCQITLILGTANNAAINQGIILNPGGGAFEITQSNLYCGPITALAAADCKLSFVECSW